MIQDRKQSDVYGLFRDESVLDIYGLVMEKYLGIFGFYIFRAQRKSHSSGYEIEKVFIYIAQRFKYLQTSMEYACLGQRKILTPVVKKYKNLDIYVVNETKVA